MKDISIRCKQTSLYNTSDITPYDFTTTPLIFNSLITYLKYVQLCNVFEMENVDHEIEKGRLKIQPPKLLERYITMYAFPVILEFYIYTDPVRQEVLQTTRIDSLKSILQIINAARNNFNDPDVAELFDDITRPDYIPVGNYKYPTEALKYRMIDEYGSLITEVLSSWNQVEEHVE